uniref:Counting factor associated protein D n=1 Tax=Aceria tosichella TaxID=561515 RepID=A0A6G1SI85_9ACAR
MRAIVALLALVCLGELVVARHDSSLLEWAQYKRQYGKVYGTPEEDRHRFTLFLASKERIRQHNANERASYKLGLNALSDWAPDELATMRAGGRQNSTIGSLINCRRPEAANDDDGSDAFLETLLNDPAPIPVEIDWRKVPNRVTPVKDRKFKTCFYGDYLFAITGVLEGQQVVRNFTKELVPLSEQQIIDCALHSTGCDSRGPSGIGAFHDVTRIGGIMSEKDYPFITKRDYCRFDMRKATMKLAGCQEVTGDENLRKLVARFGPVFVGHGYIGNFIDYKSGIFDDPTCSVEVYYYGLVIGYGHDPKVGDYWILKNSLSSSWGEDGYYRIKRGLCGIGKVLTIIPTF